MKAPSKAAAPLLEMLIAVVIFAIAGGMILNMFLSARYTQTSAADQTSAMYQCQSQAEKTMLYLDENYPEKLMEQVIYFDKNWKICGENAGKFIMEVKVDLQNTQGGRMYAGFVACAKIEPYPFIKNGSENLFALDFSRFVPKIQQ